MLWQHLMITPAAQFTERCHIHNPMDLPMAGRKEICVRCASILHAPRWCILPRIKVGKAACTSFQDSTHHVLRSPPTTAVEEHPGERRKTPSSLDINLITTRLSIAANRRVLNRLSYSTSQIGLTTSRCAPFIDLFKDFVDFQSRPLLLRCRVTGVAHIFLNY